MRISLVFVFIVHIYCKYVFYIINFASCVKKIKKIRLSQKEVERSPPSETSRRIVAGREVLYATSGFIEAWQAENDLLSKRERRYNSVASRDREGAPDTS